MVDIPSGSHPDASGQSLEDAFNLVVFVGAARLDIQVHGCGVAERLEEMKEHFGRHVSDAFPFEFSIPDKPCTSSEIECHLAETVVHGQAEAVSFDAPFVAQCLSEAASQADGRIFDGVVFVHFQISFRVNGQIHASVFADLFEHVVEEPQSGMDVAGSVSVQIDADIDVCFPGSPAFFRNPFSGNKPLL